MVYCPNCGKPIEEDRFEESGLRYNKKGSVIDLSCSNCPTNGTFHFKKPKYEKWCKT